MSRRTIAIIILFISVPIGIYFFMPGDKARIKKLVKRGATAVEQEDIEKVLSDVSFTYSDEYGMSYLTLKKGFERFFAGYDDIRVEVEKMHVEVKDKSATAEVYVRVVASHGADRGYVFGDVSEPVMIIFLLEKEKISWHIISSKGIPRYY